MKTFPDTSEALDAFKVLFEFVFVLILAKSLESVSFSHCKVET